MKTFIARIFNVFMAVAVVASSMGFGFVEHSCLMSGKKTTSFSKPKTCFADKRDCSKPVGKHQSFKKSKCCKDEQKYENVEFSSSSSSHFLKTFQPVFDFVRPIFQYDFQFVIGEITTIFSSFYSSSSPPLSGRDLLILIQIFRI